MDPTPLTQAARRYRTTETAFKAARDDLQAAAVAAIRAGTSQADVVRETGWTREYLRRLKADADKAEAEAEISRLRRQLQDLTDSAE